MLSQRLRRYWRFSYLTRNRQRLVRDGVEGNCHILRVKAKVADGRVLNLLAAFPKQDIIY